MLAGETSHARITWHEHAVPHARTLGLTCGYRDRCTDCRDHGTDRHTDRYETLCEVVQTLRNVKRGSLILESIYVISGLYEVAQVFTMVCITACTLVCTVCTAVCTCLSGWSSLRIFLFLQATLTMMSRVPMSEATRTRIMYEKLESEPLQAQIKLSRRWHREIRVCQTGTNRWSTLERHIQIVQNPNKGQLNKLNERLRQRNMRK